MKMKIALSILALVSMIQAEEDLHFSPFDLPQTARDIADIRAKIGTKDAQGAFIPLKPQLKELVWNQTKYLVAPIDPSLGNEPYLDVYLYCYSDHFKEWRCFQTTHFRGANMIECKLDVVSGMLTITDATNNSNRGRVLMTFNLAAAYH